MVLIFKRLYARSIICAHVMRPLFVYMLKKIKLTFEIILKKKQFYRNKICKKKANLLFKMPTLNLNGIEVQFPYEPYPCQIDYMKGVLESITNVNIFSTCKKTREILKLKYTILLF
jgi:hypothetical protein